jgi:hypothetical protein
MQMTGHPDQYCFSPTVQNDLQRTFGEQRQLELRTTQELSEVDDPHEYGAKSHPMSVHRRMLDRAYWLRQCGNPYEPHDAMFARVGSLHAVANHAWRTQAATLAAY